MNRTAKLSGLKIGAFFPWQTDHSSGARTRFNSYWRYLLLEGAHVTLGLLNECRFKRYDDLELRDFTAPRRYELESERTNHHSQLMMNPGCGEIGKEAALFLHLFRAENYAAIPGFTEWAEGIIRDVDVVTIDYPMMVPFLAPLCKKHGKRFLVTAHDALHKLHGNNEMATKLLREQEIASFEQADSLIFVSENDRRSFGDVHPYSQIVVNTGDVHNIVPAPTPKEIVCLKQSTGIGDRPFIFFVGSYHLPNIQAVQQLKMMAQFIPEVDVVVAGGCWPREHRDNFHSLNYISEAVLGALYHASSLVVIPLAFGTGSSLKFFEAMAYGKTVLSTTVGIRGHDVTPGREVLVCDNLESYPRIIRELIATPKVRETLGMAARAHAESIDFRLAYSPYASELRRIAPVEWATQTPKRKSRKRLKLIMADPGIKDDIGHYLGYATSIMTAAEEMGFEFRALVHKNATPEARDAVNGIPCFHHGIHETVDGHGLIRLESAKESRIFSLLKTNEAFGIDLWRGLDGLVGLDDHIFVPNITERQFIGLASAISLSNIGVAPRCHAMLRYPLWHPTLRNEGDTPIEVVARSEVLVEDYQAGFGLLRRVYPDARLRLVTDSEGLATEYASITDLPIDVVPIPHTAPPSTVDERFQALLPRKRPQQLRLVYLGDARAEKGFGMLPFAVLALTDYFGANRVQFVLQSFISSIHHTEMREAVEALESFDLPNVHLIKRPLSSTEYHTLLGSADLVLLPYNNNAYRSRTSGPLVESLSAGKPVVAPGRTWMSKQIGASGAGALFQEPTDEAFFAACVAAIEDHGKVATNAETFARVYREYHNPASFMREMFGRYVDPTRLTLPDKHYKPAFPGLGYILG